MGNNTFANTFASLASPVNGSQVKGGMKAHGLMDPGESMPELTIRT